LEKTLEDRILWNQEGATAKRKLRWFAKRGEEKK